MAQSRKDFIKNTILGIGGFSLLGAGCKQESVFQPSTKPIKGSLFLNKEEVNSLSNKSFEELRKLMYMRSDSLYAPLNSSNLSLVYGNSLESLRLYQEELFINPNFINRQNFVNEKVETARESMAELLGVNPHEVSFTRNTSEGNATIIEGLDLKQGDEVLLWKYNHPTNYRSWYHESKKKGFTPISVDTEYNNSQIDYYVNAFASKLTSKTKVVSFSHISNTTGLTLPVAQLIKKIKAVNPDIHVHIDGAQSMGSLSFNLKDLDVDSYVSSGQKFLCSTWGTGVLFIKEKLMPGIFPNTLGYNLEFNYPMDVNLYDDYDNKRYEAYGQRDIAKYGALGDTIKTYLAIGPKRIEERIKYLTNYTIKRAEEMGLKPINKSPLVHSVICIDLGNKIKAQGAFLGLNNMGIGTAYVDSHHTLFPEEEDDTIKTWLRFSPNWYNNETDIDAALDYVQKIDKNPFKIVGELIEFVM